MTAARQALRDLRARRRPANESLSWGDFFERPPHSPEEPARRRPRRGAAVDRPARLPRIDDDNAQLPRIEADETTDAPEALPRTEEAPAKRSGFPWGLVGLGALLLGGR